MTYIFKFLEPLIVQLLFIQEQQIKIQNFLKNKVKLYNTKGLMHCFSSSKELAKTALDNDFFISIAGMVTFKNSHDLKKLSSIFQMIKF